MFSLLRIFLLIYLCVNIGSSLYAQSGISHQYTMDDCTLEDNVGNTDGVVFSLGCECGVQTNGLTFENGAGFAEFDDPITDLLMDDWSMTFYVQVKNQGTESVDVLFLGERCGLDSILSLRYLPGSRRFRFVLSDSPNNEVQVDGLLDDNSCWQYVAITKERAVVRMYINGVLTEEDAARSDLSLNVNGRLSISNSPCQDL